MCLQLDGCNWPPLIATDPTEHLSSRVPPGRGNIKAVFDGWEHMMADKYYVLTSLLIGLTIGGLGMSAVNAQEQQGTVVRIAELVIDPAQLDAYKLAVKEEMDDAIRLEPGVLAIYSVAEKDRPSSLRFFEIYASEDAYRAHIESPHFKKYVATTQSMILSRKLIETVPVHLSVKPQ
jgi:quinol monooxygenase YgiN